MHGLSCGRSTDTAPIMWKKKLRLTVISLQRSHSGSEAEPAPPHPFCLPPCPASHPSPANPFCSDHSPYIRPASSDHSLNMPTRIPTSGLPSHDPWLREHLPPPPALPSPRSAGGGPLCVSLCLHSCSLLTPKPCGSRSTSISQPIPSVLPLRARAPRPHTGSQPSAGRHPGPTAAH